MTERPARQRPRTIPEAARERATSASAGPARAGGPFSFDYFVRRVRVARVHYHPTGKMAWELHFDAEGRLHGLEREGDDRGHITYRARWRHGLQVGRQEQWDAHGRRLVETTFVDGTGLDLWYCGHAAWEERHFVGGVRHGVERLWSGVRRVFREVPFAHGVEHGVAREWTDDGAVRRGWPRYFVAGRRVDRRAYERARRDDRTLPPPDRGVTCLRRPPKELVLAAQRVRAR